MVSLFFRNILYNELMVLQVKALSHLLTRKTMYIKIKYGNPSIKSTRQMKAQKNTTQRKNKSKQSTKKEGENLMQIGPMIIK
jgi:hypothetical protein